MRPASTFSIIQLSNSRLLIIFLILVVIIGSVSYGETMSDYYYYGY